MARTQGIWIQSEDGTWIYLDNPEGFNILINGENHYINFGAISGVDGYGFRDNNGVIEFKNSAGDWTPVGTGGEGSTTLLPATGLVNDNNMVFSFTEKPKLININGQQYWDGATISGIGTVWSWNAGTLEATLAFPVGTGGCIIGIK